MCNCGKKRTEYSQRSRYGAIPTPANKRPGIPVQTTSYAGFEYTGKTALTIRGNVTGMEYRFNFPGTRQSIDYRDVPGIRTIPVLKKVS